MAAEQIEAPLARTLKRPLTTDAEIDAVLSEMKSSASGYDYRH